MDDDSGFGDFGAGNRDLRDPRLAGAGGAGGMAGLGQMLGGMNPAQLQGLAGALGLPVAGDARDKRGPRIGGRDSRDPRSGGRDAGGGEKA